MVDIKLEPCVFHKTWCIPGKNQNCWNWSIGPLLRLVKIDK